MDKNNKKEQTFSDLFSNISNKSEKDNNQISFNSINNKNSEDKEKVTLENLFNKSQKLDSKENNIEDNKSKNNSIKFQGFNFNPETDNSSTKNTFEKSNTNPENNNSNQKEEKNIQKNNDSQNENTTPQNIFEKENTNLDNKTISKDKNESKLTEVSQNNISLENDNFPPNIFDTTNINENKKTNLEIFTKEESSQDNNPILKSNNDSIFDNNIKNADNSQKENADTLSENNPFFNNKTTKPLENDSLQKKESNLTEENFISENLLFTEEKDDEEKKLEPEEFDTNKEAFTSENPFFTEEKQDEINPLFDNKLNLVENKNYNTNDNLKNKIDTSNTKHYNVKILNKKEPLIKFILGVLSYAVFIWLLLIGITLLIYVADIKIRAAKGDYSSPTFNAYVVLTGSMLPDIQVYDVVVTKKVDAKVLKEGDIITFASSDTRFLNTIITHRIIKKYYDSETKTYTFQTKGDNNNVADSALVQPNNIYGKVILKLPKLGYLQEFLASDGGWIIVILIPCLIVISYDIVKLIKGLKRKKYKNIKVQK